MRLTLPVYQCPELRYHAISGHRRGYTWVVARKMLLNDTDIAALLRQEAITDAWPWNTNDEAVVHKHIKDVVAEVRRKMRLVDKTEFGHYGAGYASFVDCWLFRETPEFQFDSGNCYWGLVVLFSTLSKYYVVGEGQKTWHHITASSYLPAFEFVDHIEHPAVREIADGVCQILDQRGMVRVRAAELSPLFSHRDRIAIPTILGDPPYRHFDALFYWED